MMKPIHLAPLAFLPLSIALGAGLFTQWTRADSAERRADGWEEIARKNGAALDDLMESDAGLKAASERLLITCAKR